MNETIIRAKNGKVVYTLPPDIAGSLAEELRHAATHYPSGRARPVHKYDRGWLDDAMRLAEVSDTLLSLDARDE